MVWRSDLPRLDVHTSKLGRSVLHTMKCAPPAIEPPATVFGSFLYMDVDSLGAAMSAAQGLEVVVAERETAYGAREILVRGPAGNVIDFADHEKR
jgi:hypothetical protein